MELDQNRNDRVHEHHRHAPISHTHNEHQEVSEHRREDYMDMPSHTHQHDRMDTYEDPDDNDVDDMQEAGYGTHSTHFLIEYLSL
jgi:hypothetical protein